MHRLTIALAALVFVANSPEVSRGFHAKVVKRAAPPKAWDRFMESQFEKDAFTTLAGDRPASFDGIQKTDDEKVPPKPDDDGETVVGNGDFDRRDMMKKLERAETALSEALSSEKSFKAGVAKVATSADLVVMMGRTLFSNDPDYSDQDDYLKFAEDMTNYAKQIKVLAKKADYDGVNAVFGKMKTTCNACHEGYR